MLSTPFSTSESLCPFLTIGQRVCIHGGSLDGLKGILTAINGDLN
jgi:hypothetical protein